jgi:hypothetical protein
MTENDITANTTLVSGNIYQNRSQNYEAAAFAPRARLMSAPASSEQAETSMLEDYTKYDVGHRIIHEQDIVELGTWSFPFVKLYIHDTNDEDTVKFGYRVIAPGFIPACSVNVYSIDSNKMIDSYLGSDTIKESQKDNEVDIMLGESTMLQCESSLIVNDMIILDEMTARQYNLPLETFINKTEINNEKRQRDDRQWHVLVEDLTIKITNHNLKSSMLLIRHFVGDKMIVDTRCMNYSKRKNSYLEWYFQIPETKENNPRKDNFTCQIVTASYY